MKTKRFISLALVLIMVLGSLGLVAADTADPYARIVENGIFIGDDGDLMLDKTFTRAEFAVVALRLMGEGFTDDETEALGISSTFEDVDADAWYAPYVGRAEEEGLVEGDAGKYLPGDDVSYVEALTIIMRALGYIDGEDLINYPDGYYAKAAQLGLADVAIDAKTKIKREIIADTLEVALDIELKDSDVTLAEKLGIEEIDVIPDILDVDEVEINTAKSFKVVFNKAVEDTDEIEFSVKRGTSKVPITVKWNDDKTEAVLEATSTKLAEGIYTIVVVDKSGEEDVELVKIDKEIGKEKVDSIEFDSDVIVRISDEIGVIGYTVRNQYGEDITDKPLGRGLDWIVSTRNKKVDPKAGMLQVIHEGEAFNQLKDLKTVVVTVRDVAAGFVTTKSFGVSDTVAVISDIELLGIINEKGEEVDLIFSPAKAYYLDFEAFDVNGKKVDYYAALNSRLYPEKNEDGSLKPDSGTPVLDVRGSNDTYIDVKLEKHPDNSSKGVYRIELKGTSGPTYDTPVSFIAMAPFTGKTSTLNTTLYKKARVDTFTLESPHETASVGKSIEIPFIAVDNNGKEVTRYEDLNGKISFSGVDEIRFVRQANGSAKLFAKFNTKGLKYITATVKDSLKGSFSQISIDVKEAAASSIIEPLRHARAYTTGATWKRNVNHFTVKDQFDRSINLRTNSAASGYKIGIESDNSNIVSVSKAEISGDDEVIFTGGDKYGTTTITYKLINPAGNVVDTASTLVYNVEMKDVKSVKVDMGHDKDLYMAKGTVYEYEIGKVGENMNNALTMVGVLDSGMEVRLSGDVVLDYTTTDGRFAFAGNKIHANGDFKSNTSATTTVTGYVRGVSGVLTASAEITAKSTAPKAEKVTVDYNKAAQRSGAISVDNDVVDVKVSDLNGKSIFKYNKATGAKIAAEDQAPFIFGVDTQYGDENSGLLSSVDIIRNGGSGTITLADADAGILSVNDVSAGAEFTITAIADGRIKAVKVKMKDGGGEPVVPRPKITVGEEEVEITVDEDGNYEVEVKYELGGKFEEVRVEFPKEITIEKIGVKGGSMGDAYKSGTEEQIIDFLKDRNVKLKKDGAVITLESDVEITEEHISKYGNIIEVTYNGGKIIVVKLEETVPELGELTVKDISKDTSGEAFGIRFLIGKLVRENETDYSAYKIVVYDYYGEEELGSGNAEEDGNFDIEHRTDDLSGFFGYTYKVFLDEEELTSDLIK